MEDSARVYQQLMEQVDRELPEIAEQVRAEIARGREISASNISEEDRNARQLRLREGKLAGISKEDITFAPYDDDDRLIVLLEALRTLAATMLASRRFLGDFTTNHHLLPTVTFMGPEESEPLQLSTAAGRMFDDDSLDGASEKLATSVHMVRESS